MTTPVKFDAHRSHQSEENTPLIQPESVRKTQLVCLSIWGFAAGLSISTAFCSRSYLPAALAPIALPLNWLICPFNPLKIHTTDHVSRLNKIYRLAMISFFSLLGLATPAIISYCLKPINNQPYSNLYKMSLILTQCALIAINLTASRKLYSQEDADSRLSVFKMIRSTQQTFSSVFVRLQGIISSNEQNDILGQNRETTKITMNDVVALREGNRNCAQIDLKFRQFIQNDEELNKSFNEHFNRTRNVLVDLPKLGEAPNVDDPVLNEYGQELMMAEFWLETSESVRDFLTKNPIFAQLLNAKFNASVIQNKDEILKFYGFI